MWRKDCYYCYYGDDDDNEGLKSQHYFKNVNQKDIVYSVIIRRKMDGKEKFKV